MKEIRTVRNPYTQPIRQIGYCEECGARVPQAELSRRIRAYGTGDGGENVLLYSSYNASFWTVDTASDAGCISLGPWTDKHRITYSDDGLGTITSTERYGAQTWEDSGTIRSTTSVDISSYTNIYLAMTIGAYHAQANQAISVSMGFCSSDGSTKYPQQTFSFATEKRCWFSLALADLEAGPVAAALYVYADVTVVDTGDQWFCDWMVLNDNTAPQACEPTTAGSAISITPNLEEWHVLTMCKECAREKNLKPSERIGDPRLKAYKEVRDAVEDL